MKKVLFLLALSATTQAFAQGGENCATATVIPSIPYSNVGSTASAVDDYYESCPDVGNAGGGKDVVYQYTTGSTTEYVNITLCIAATNYDSQLFVYESTCTGTPYACKEDGCQSPAFTNPFNSEIINLMLSPSTTYYIVVDGYNAASSGTYQLDVTAGAGVPTAIVPFTDATNLLPTSTFHSGNAIGVADMNNDGLDDIIRAANNAVLTIDFQQSGGTFTESSFPSSMIGDPWGMCIGDYNNDGYNDLLYGDFYTTYILQSVNATNYISSNVSDSTGAGYIFVQGANFFDINNDGNLDAFVCNDVAMSHIYVGDGAGNWTFDQSLMPLATVPASDNSGNYASIFADINNDDKTDFFITHCRQSVASSLDPRRIDQIFLNNGDFTYTQDVTNATGLRSGAQGWSTDFADFDNDGDLDAFILNYNVNSEFMVNNGSGVFTNSIATTGIASTTSFFGMNVVCEDFNNDGYIDMFLSGTDEKMYINNGDMTFTLDADGLVYGTNKILAAATGDLNHDGKVDIYASYCDVYNSPSTRDDKLFLNSVSNGNHFICFNLEGVVSNKNGIGAKIKIYGPWGVQVREVRSGEAYGINNSFSAHFGLGSTTTIDSVHVVWPSGAVDALMNVTADQWVDVVEGSSPLSVSELNTSNNVFVYPNPSTGMLNINLSKAGNGSVVIRDMSGRIVLTKELRQSLSVIDISSFENGIYSFEIRSEGKTTTGKVIKQ